MKFLFGGDLYSGSYGNGKTESLFMRKEFERVLVDVKALFDQADHSFLNLEAPVTKKGQPITKTGPNLKNQSEVVEALRYLNATGVMLANNHIMDYGERGLMETLTCLADAHLHHMGAGSQEDKRKPLQYNDGKAKTVLLNFAENEWITTRGGTGANPVDFADNFSDIRAAKQKGNVIIVNVHTGNEFNPVPSPWQKKLCRFYVDAGADVVICHHTHVISGFECYNGKYIHYGIGNFLFDNAKWKSASLRQGVLLSVEVDAGGIDVRQHMLKLQADAKLEIIAQPDWRDQQRINECLQDNVKLEDEYGAYMRRTTAQYLSYLQPYPDFLKRFFKKGLLPSIQTKASKKLLMNLIRCESHREVVIRMLEDQLEKNEKNE